MTDDDGPEFDAARFNAEQRDGCMEPLDPADGFPCWICGRRTPLAELAPYGYECEDCRA